jgi:hypothetical protein
MKDKTKIVTIICLSGVIILLLLLLAIKIIEVNPKNQEQLQIKFVYNNLIEKYKKDKEKSTIIDGKYSSTSLYKDGNELKYLGEFNIENGNLIHLCISDGSKKLDIKYDDITNKYLKENAKFERSIETCEFSE